jgi:hypothetical protein
MPLFRLATARLVTLFPLPPFTHALQSTSFASFALFVQ